MDDNEEDVVEILILLLSLSLSLSEEEEEEEENESQLLFSGIWALRERYVLV